MQRLTKITFALFVLTLPACVYSAVPAVLSALIFLSLYAEERFVRYGELQSHTQIEKEISKLRSEVDGLNLRAGLSPRL